MRARGLALMGLQEIFEIRGKPSNKVIRKGMFKTNHFDDDLNFVYVEIDRVTSLVCWMPLYSAVSIW